LSLPEFHARLATSVVVFAALAGLWALTAYLRRRGVAGSLWGILAVGELLLLAQGVVGLILLLEGEKPARAVHILYGVVAAIGLPAYFAYSKGRDDRSAALHYALLCFFLVGIGLRAIGTAG